MVSRPRRRLPAGVTASMPRQVREIRGQLARCLIGEVQQEPAAALPDLRDAAQDFLFELRAHARKFAQFLVAAKLLELVDGGDLEVLEEHRDALGAESLDLEEFERGRREFFQQFVALVEAALRFDLLQHRGEAFADAWHIGDFALGIRQDRRDALGIAFDGRCAVAIAADAKAVFARNLHQVGGFVEDPREFTIFQDLILPGLGCECMAVLASDQCGRREITTPSERRRKRCSNPVRR